MIVILVIIRGPGFRMIMWVWVTYMIFGKEHVAHCEYKNSC